jgi:hypothetical protein
LPDFLAGRRRARRRARHLLAGFPGRLPVLAAFMERLASFRQTDPL